MADDDGKDPDGTPPATGEGPTHIADVLPFPPPGATPPTRRRRDRGRGEQPPGGDVGALPPPREFAPVPELRRTEGLVDEVADELRKRMARAMASPDAERAFMEGLTATDLRERRAWWQLGAEICGAKPLPGAKGGGGDGGVRINFFQNVPSPPHEDGPTFDVTPPKKR